MHESFVIEIAHFLSHRLSRKGIFLWVYLRDSISHSWKEWCALSQEYGLLAFDHPSIVDIQGFILEV